MNMHVHCTSQSFRLVYTSRRYTFLIVLLGEKETKKEINFIQLKRNVPIHTYATAT